MESSIDLDDGSAYFGGNVGIGTTNPGYRLSLGSPSADSNSSKVAIYEHVGYGDYFYGLGLAGGPTTTGLAFWGGTESSAPSSTNVHLFIRRNSGNVGVGTITPATKLHIYDASSGPILTLSGSNNKYRGLTIKNVINDSEQWFVGNNESNNFVIRATGSNDILTVSSNTGNVGIGTTTPSTTLHIYPHTNIEGLRIVSSNYSPLVIRDSTDWNDLFRVNQSGDVTAVTSSATRMRSNNYCDADGANCFDPSGGWGSVSYFATVTSSTYNGNNNGHPGYAYAHARCKDQLAGSHVCSAEEILNTIRENKTMPTVGVWIFNGPPGYEAVANDCAARTIDSAGTSGDYKYGSYWQAPSDSYPQGKGLLMKCNVSLKLACCL